MSTSIPEPGSSPEREGGAVRRQPGLDQARRFALVLGVIALVLGGASFLRGVVPSWNELFGTETTESSSAPLLLAMEDLAEFHAGSGTFQVVVEREEDQKLLPSIIAGESTTYLATGSVDAVVDFRNLDPESVTLSEDGKSARIELPEPTLEPAQLDLSQSRVIDRDRGVLNRVEGALGESPTDDQAVQLLAQERIGEAASQSDLLERARENTDKTLTGLARALGVEKVEIVFVPART